MIHNAEASQRILQALDYDRMLLLCDENVERLVWPRLPLLKHIPKLVIPPGEATKTQSTTTHILEQMHQHGLTRQSLLIGLGGGVVTDLAGFCASIYMRGIEVIHIPTTVLGMVDAAIGGKTGINTHWGKNMVGSFHAPQAVLYLPDVLETLPERHHKAGFVEAWKTTLMCRPQQWDTLHYPLHIEQIMDIAKIKQALVDLDFNEQGARAWLNFGHSFGHAFEHLYSPSHGLLHGEAIAWGMLTELILSKENSTFLRHWGKWVAAHMPKLPFTPSDADQILNILRSDKKNLSNEQRFALPLTTGSAVVSFDEAAQQNALRILWANHLAL